MIADKPSRISPEGRARISAATKARAAYKRWNPEQVAQARELAAQGLPAKVIGAIMGYTRGTVVIRCHEHGIPFDGRVMQSKVREAGAVVLREHYPTMMPLADIHARWRDARGGSGSLSTMIEQARGLKLNRPIAIYAVSGRAGNSTRSAIARSIREARAPALQALVDTGIGLYAAAQQCGLSEDTAYRMKREGLVKMTTRAKPGPVVGSTRPKRYAPERQGRVLKIARPRFAAQTVEEYLAQGGTITRCPTAMAVETVNATLPAEDMAAMAKLHAERIAAQGKLKPGHALRRVTWRRTEAMRMQQREAAD